MATLGSLSMRPLGGLLEQQRVRLCCGVLLAIDLSVFLFMVAGTHGLIVPLAKPTSTDFVSFYAAGNLADAGTPELAYDRAEHYAAEERAAEVGIDYNFFYYPPTFLLLCAVLGHLPYIVAFLIFEMATLSLFVRLAQHPGRTHLDDSRAASRLPSGAMDIRLGPERVSDCRAVWRGDGLDRPATGGRGPSLRSALLQAAFRSTGPSGACRWRLLACIRSSFRLGCCAMPLVADRFRLGNMARFPGGSGRIPCRLSIRADPVQWLHQLVRSGAVARRNPVDGLRSSGSHDSGCRASGGVRLAAPPPAADQGGDARCGDARRRPLGPVLRSDAGRGCDRLAGARRWNTPTCRVGKTRAGGAVPSYAQSAQFDRDFAPADRTPRHSGVRRFRRFACGAGRGHGPEPQIGSPCTSNHALSSSPPAGNKSSTRPIP